MNEQNRLEALASYQILDSTPEQAFDEITQLASLICDKPIALITLLDSERQWFKSKVGLDKEINETPREIAFCNYAIESPKELMEVENALKDKRFSNNSMVTKDPNIRFYAGMPLVTPDGYPLGTLCLIDTKPAKLNSKQKEALRILAKKAMRLIEIHKKETLANNRLDEAQETAGIGSWDWNLETNELYWTDELYRQYGLNPDEHKINYELFASLIHPEDKDSVLESINASMQNQNSYIIEHRIIWPNGTVRWTMGKGGATANSDGKVVRMNGIGMDITKRKEQESERDKYVEELEKLLFNLSHEVRKPVATLLGIAGIKDIEELDESELKRISQYIKSSTSELDKYTRKMSQFFYNHKEMISAKQLT